MKESALVLISVFVLLLSSVTFAQKVGDVLTFTGLGSVRDSDEGSFFVIEDNNNKEIYINLRDSANSPDFQKCIEEGLKGPFQVEVTVEVEEVSEYGWLGFKLDKSSTCKRL